ncbi:MAG: hypothetical protein ACTSRP_04985 [Candidatus Helarchaeota archaeon]
MAKSSEFGKAIIERLPNALGPASPSPLQIPIILCSNNISEIFFIKNREFSYIVKKKMVKKN